jgi:hypothetical protein
MTKPLNEKALADVVDEVVEEMLLEEEAAEADEIERLMEEEADEILQYLKEAIQYEPLEASGLALAKALSLVLAEFAEEDIVASLLLRQSVVHIITGSIR